MSFKGKSRNSASPGSRCSLV